MRKILWFVCTARNAFVIVIVSVIAFGIDPTASGHKFTMTGEIQGGLPAFKISGLNTLFDSRVKVLKKILFNGRKLIKT